MFVISVGRIGSGGKKTGTTLPAREVTLGRGADNDLVLEDTLVSRKHCRLVAIEGGALVLDKGSSNGTWLNGTPVAQPSLLRFEDELVIGPYVLRVQSLVGRCTSGVARQAVISDISFDGTVTAMCQH